MVTSAGFIIFITIPYALIPGILLAIFGKTTPGALEELSQ